MNKPSVKENNKLSALSILKAHFLINMQLFLKFLAKNCFNSVLRY